MSQPVAVAVLQGGRPAEDGCGELVWATDGDPQATIKTAASSPTPALAAPDTCYTVGLPA